MSAFEKEMLAGNFKQSKTTRGGFNPVIAHKNIPQFVIPPLARLDSNHVFRNRKSMWKYRLGHYQDEEVLEGKKRSLIFSFEDPLDPVTRAAMSLPHLAKTTTPYGFLMLAESPHVPNGEDVFFQTTTSRRRMPVVRSFSMQNTLISDTECTGHGATSPDTVAHQSDQNSTTKNFLPFRRTVFFRQSSMPAINNGSDAKTSVEDKKPATIPHRSNSFPKVITRKSSIRLLQSVIKKHFSTKNLSKEEY